MSHWMSSLCEVCAVMHQVSSLCEVCAFIHQMSSLCGDCCLHVKTGVSMWDLCHDPSNVFSVGSLCCNPPNVFFMWILCHDTSNVFFMWSLCHFSSTVLFIWLSQNKTIYDFPVLARMLHSFIHLIQLELKTIFLKKKKVYIFHVNYHIVCIIATYISHKRESFQLLCFRILFLYQCHSWH